MRLSLSAKVSALLVLIIISISSVSTYFFVSLESRSREKRLIERGTALSQALSRAAEEGLATENLDLLKKASYIIQSEDVKLVQVYSDLWEAIDAYPFEKLKEPPKREAAVHFAASDSPFYLKTDRAFDFYMPIRFRPSGDFPAVRIGFVRIILSSSHVKEGTRRAIISNVTAASIITLLAILAINVLVGKLVMRPVMSLYAAMSRFRDGELPAGVPPGPSDEIRELHLEFVRMCNSITEKERKLVESEQRTTSLFNRVEHAIFRLDRRGSVVDSNPRFKELFGEAVALCEILSGSRAADCLKSFPAEKVVHSEEKVCGKHGEELTVLLSLYAVADDDGEVDGFDGYIIDVTDKRRLEERLLRAQKLEAVGTLAGGIAHDFNNLLAGILGYSEILLDLSKQGDPVYKPASIIHSAAEKGAELTKRILAVTRKEKLETKPVDVNEVVRGSVELLQRSIPKNIEIVTDLAGEAPVIMADAAQLQQVLLNLAVNARDAMPDGGRLTIETVIVGKENGAAGIPASKGSFVKLSVSDTGIGISKDIQGKIFDPFFTLKETGKGTGLGLYIVHSIVNGHGGYINFYSEPSRGTHFNVYFPLAEAAEIEGSPMLPELGGSGTVLVIDDETHVRELCTDMLTPLGYKVLAAGSGDDGITLFRENRDKISLVLLDMVMPRISGSEIFQTLRTIDPSVKIILCSGYSPSGFAGIENLLKEGAAGFLQKPFTRQAIATSIKAALHTGSSA